jgi:hypothetical protein
MVSLPSMLSLPMLLLAQGTGESEGNDGRDIGDLFSIASLQTDSPKESDELLFLASPL